MALPIKYFRGRLAGVTIEELKRQLSYNVTILEERLKLLESIVNEDGLPNHYFTEYFDAKLQNGVDCSHFKVNINKSDYLSHDINVCNVLETMADYILYSPDSTPITKKTKYNFYKKDKFNKKLAAEASLEAIVDHIKEGKGASYDKDVIGEVIDFLVRDEANYRVEIKQNISSSDLEDEDLSCIKEYQDLVQAMQSTIERIENEGALVAYGEDKIKSMLKKKREDNISKKELKNLEGKLRYKLRNQKTFIKKDQIYCKDKLKGTIYFKSPLKGEENTDWLLFNFTDIDQVKALLKLSNKNISSDKGILIMDLNKLIDETTLNNKERRILKLYRENDATFEKIAQEMGDSASAIKQTIDRIIKKIIKRYKEKYIDWVHSKYVSGIYKMCKRCGEVKLIQKFNKDKTKKYGVKNICKECLKSNK